jgi:predicted DCC family thiol-disulfide oxidoreductase YuxK
VTTGWTGGQYSLFRALLGGAIAGLAARLAWTSAPLPVTGALALASVFALLLAIGHEDRVAAIALLALGGYLSFRRFIAFSPGLAYLGVLLLAHVAMPRAPYGSWAARGRADPGGSWRVPGSVWLGLWIAAAPPLAPLLAWRRARPWAWALSLAAHGTMLAMLGCATAIPAALLLHLFLCDPAWVAPLASAGTDALFYDGHCGLCHRAVRFVLAEDCSGAAFRFLPLDTSAFYDALTERERANLPDSLVVKAAGGAILVRSRGVRYILARLGGLWRCLALAAALVPPRVLDRLYDAVAAVRRRLFVPPPDACPLVPEHLRSRFPVA